MGDTVPLPRPDKVYSNRWGDGSDATYWYSPQSMRAHAAAVSAADNAALRADAERYRFLRDVAWHEGALLPFLERYGPFEWDDAIDEARGEI